MGLLVPQIFDEAKQLETSGEYSLTGKMTHLYVFPPLFFTMTFEKFQQYLSDDSVFRMDAPVIAVSPVECLTRLGAGEPVISEDRVVSSTDDFALPRSADFIVLLSEDPEACLVANGESMTIGRGVHLIYQRACCFSCLAFRHKNNFRLRKYMVPENSVFRILEETSYVYTLGGTSILYNLGSLFPKPAESVFSEISASYNATFESTGLRSTLVYGNEVNVLHQDPRMNDICHTWDKDWCRHSAPPCIEVVVHESKVAEFEDFVKREYPNCLPSRWTVCDREVVVADTVKHASAMKNLMQKVDQVTKLIELGVLSYKPL